MITIKNKTARLLVCEQFPFPPGVTPGKGEDPIPEDTLRRILANDQFKLWQRLGWIKVRMAEAPAAPAPPPAPTVPAADDESAADDEPPAPPLSELAAPPLSELTAPADPFDRVKDMGVAEARTVIRGCDDPETLLEWYERDSRKTIKEWCEHRIKQLEEVPSE